MGESAISIKGLKKDYNVGAGEVHALRGIDTVSYTHLTLPTN